MSSTALHSNPAATTSPKVFIRSFGCQMNEYDSQKLLDLLSVQCGYQITQDINQASLILLNTCSIREKAESKVYDDLGRIHHLKKKSPDLLIGVGGCVASQEGAHILKRAPFVDFVFGPQTLHRVPQMIHQRYQSGQAQIDIHFPEIEKFDHLPIRRFDSDQAKASAFVSIMEGCSKYCTFCVVPYTRGEEFSRPLDDILTECALLTAQGVRDITLLGQNVNAWRGKTTADKPLQFADLLACVHALPELGRLRYTTSHPLEFNHRLIAAHRELPKLARHIHLPVQSGSDRILQAMRRGYTALEYLSIIRQLRTIDPHLSISSDFIVGFPGETEKDFQATMTLLEKANFDQSFSFIYSPRPGTPAANLPDDTPLAEKRDRLNRLQTQLNQQAAQYSQRLVGTQQDVLVEGPSRRRQDELMGRASDNRVVNFAGELHLIGQFVKINITAASPHSLRGHLLNVCTAPTS